MAIARPSARKQQADATRARLFAAAVQLFVADGYHGTTVDMIAKKAGVAKGTFFVHFPTKDAVVLELVRRQTSAARAARTAALAATAGRAGHLAALRAAVIELGAQAGLSRQLSRAVLAATLTSQPLADDADALFRTVLDDMIADARAAGHNAQLAHGLMAAYLGAAFHFAANPTSAPMSELLAPLVANILEGTRDPKRPAARRARKRM